MGHDDSPPPKPASTPVPAREGAPKPPTPVRASLGEDRGEAERDETVPTTVELEVDGTSWTACVGGMSRSGAGQASAPVLLVRFERTGTVDSAPREAWVVARSLDRLTDLQLEAAFRHSEPAPADWERKPLFPETGSRSGKDPS